jgi:hypothetical protein
MKNNILSIGDSRMILSLAVVVIVLTVMFSGCISQAPDAINPNVEDSTGEEAEIDSQIGNLEDLDGELADSDFADMDEDLAAIGWE